MTGLIVDKEFIIDQSPVGVDLMQFPAQLIRQKLPCPRNDHEPAYDLLFLLDITRLSSGLVCGNTHLCSKGRFGLIYTTDFITWRQNVVGSPNCSASVLEQRTFC